MPACDTHRNSSLQVVLAPATHLYFDHPYEPDPEEHGLYWACRFIDTRKVFQFAPDNLMSNADVKLTGEKITKSDLRVLQELEGSTELEKPENIQGTVSFDPRLLVSVTGGCSCLFVTGCCSLS